MQAEVRRLPSDDSPLLRGREYQVPWDGGPLSVSPYLAFDTETDVVDLTREVPRLACLTATNGTRTVVVSPGQTPDFVRLHQHAKWVGHNSQFDFAVVRSELCRQGAARLVPSWDAVVADGRLRDTMLLDFLVALGEGRLPQTRNLGRVAADVLNTKVDKEDLWRKRFGETIGRDWREVPPEAWEYAVRDVVVTWELYHRLIARADAVRERSGAPYEMWERFGPLTEGLQVRASVALAQVGRNGMAVDLGRVQEAASRLKERIDERVARLEVGCPALFRRYKEKARRGQLQLNKLTGVPKTDAGALRGALGRVAAGLGMDAETLPRTPKTKALSTALDLWCDVAPADPFVTDWAGLADDAKVLQFLVKLTEPVVHASYRTIVRTGRTSCVQPNVQQMPRDPWFRSLFVARPGHQLIVVDYSAIELVTLASVCYDRFGRSVLGDQIKAGRDPHCYTAALVGGQDYEDMVAGVAAEKKGGTPGFIKARQAAKAVNFGVPGGLGAKKLAAYAKANYRVVLSLEEAQTLRDRLTQEVYPEIGEYLKDDFWRRLSFNLECPRVLVKEALENALGCGAGLPYVLERMIEGRRVRNNGTWVSPAWTAEVFDILAGLCNDPGLRRAIGDWGPGDRLKRRLLGETVVTRTGRVRRDTSYSEARNTPFQGLAADGAKLALWRLHQAGHKVVAFVHDEIVVEAECGRAEAVCEEVCRVMKEVMSAVVGHGLPVNTEHKIGETWSK